MARRLALVLVTAMLALGVADVRLGGATASAEVVKFRRGGKAAKKKPVAKKKARAKAKPKRSKPAKKKKPAAMVKRPMP